jgi:type I restriction enzyme S subunit
VIEGWKEYRLGDLGKIITGRTPPSSRPECFGGEFPFITPSDMIGQKQASTTERYLSTAGAELLQRNLLPPRSVAVSCIGWQMGKAIVTVRPSFTNQQLNAIIPHKSVDSDFLYYALVPWRDHLLSLGASTGVRTPILNKSAFSELRIHLPPLPTQRKIAAILSAYDDLIENNTRRIALLEAMARLIYREWFVHFRFPGHENVRLAESEVGPVPEGWEITKLGDVAQEIRRSIEPEEVDPETPYVGLEHIPRKSIALTDWGKVDQVQSTKLIFKKGEILFGKIRPYFHKVVVAPVDGICSTDAIVILPKKAEHFSVLLCCVSSEYFVEYATTTSQGTKMPRADWRVLTKYPLVLPPKGLLERFNTLLQDIVAQIQNLIFRNHNLRRARDLLLPRLISGEVEVAELEIEHG